MKPALDFTSCVFQTLTLFSLSCREKLRSDRSTAPTARCRPSLSDPSWLRPAAQRNQPITEQDWSSGERYLSTVWPVVRPVGPHPQNRFCFQETSCSTLSLILNTTFRCLIPVGLWFWSFIKPKQRLGNWNRKQFYWWIHLTSGLNRQQLQHRHHLLFFNVYMYTSIRVWGNISYLSGIISGSSTGAILLKSTCFQMVLQFDSQEKGILFSTFIGTSV